MKQFLIVAICVSFFSCQKNEAGGSSEISGKVTHHEKVIPFSRVFIKYNATEFPGADTTKYDAKFSTGSDGTYTFKLFKGDYFLYGYGYDPGVPGAVVGGLHIGLRKNEKNATNVPVTEL